MRDPFSLIVVHGDGAHVLRVNLPRWIAYATLGLIAAVASATIGLSGGYVVLLRESGRRAALRQRVDDQRVLDSLETRIAAVRSEIATWRTLHDKMWKASGLAAGPDRTAIAAGGGPLAASAPVPAGEPLAEGELDLLATNVADEGLRLRELEHTIGRMGKVMSALPLTWPVHGQIDSEYGMRRSPWNRAKREHHDGLDIGSPPGTPIKSPAPGTVVAASAHGGYGKNVVLDHGNGVKSRYAHLKKIDVKTGQRVAKGDVLGLVGSTGRSTGPHLHYEVLVEDKPVNPHDFLPQP
ncbi:MAG: M23 family metallopeptidase [Deltaproteobacteria bacterium]|nr:MAG: M23 family metallopeptidase [Deltaproteobacteria bacterium]